MGNSDRAVLVTGSPAGSSMAFKYIIPLLLIAGSQAVRQLRQNTARDQRSLLNTFPFNSGAQEQHHGHHEEHHGHHEEAPVARQSSQDLGARFSFQGEDGPPSFDDVAAAPESGGKRCIDKVEMVEETEYDDVVQCDHSYDRRCHTTYTTNYESQQEEDCDENFRKSCFIEYEQTAFNETAEVCRTEYESECWTKQEVHDVQDDVVECETVVEEKCEDNTSGYTTTTDCSKWPKEVCNVSKKQVKKYTPITACTKEPRELCAPAGCGFKEGREECFEKVQTVVQDAPKEQCTLEPQRTCKHVTKLVPKLEPTEECVDVPKEVCTRSRTNPRKVKKPVVKKWCYVPSEESGLA